MSTPDNLSILSNKPFSDAVVQLDRLLQSERAFLLGAGCSKCAGLPLITELTQIVAESDKLNQTSKDILVGITKEFGSETDSHIEDYLSELVDLLAIAERRAKRQDSETSVLVCNRRYFGNQLRAAAGEIKLAIADAINDAAEIKTHRAFVRAVHKEIRVGKAASNAIVDYLVLNYDTVLEDALAIERIPFSDGIDGGATGWWNTDTFERDALKARVLKLHGSVNWSKLSGESLPRRIPPSLQVQDMQDRSILIWPASTKYRETQLDPFAQLAERARRVMRPVPGSQRVLVICGYAFGDAHINFEIDKALHESSRDLTVIVFSSEEEPSGCLKKWNQTAEICDQVLIFAKRGFFHGAVAERSECDLPWWKFENVVRFLGGER